MVRRLAYALSLLALAGCSGIDHARLDGVTPMPDGSTLSEQVGLLNAGIATGFTPRVWTHDFWGTHEQTSGIEVQSSNTSVLRVGKVTNDKRVVAWGYAPGQATLTVTYNGDIALEVPVTVSDPPP